MDTNPQRQEAVRVPEQNVVDHLLKHGHKNQTVQDFIQNVIVKLKRDIDKLTDEKVDTNSGDRGAIYVDKNTYYSSLAQLQEGFDAINSYFAAIIAKQITPDENEAGVALVNIINPLRAWIGFAPGVKYEATGKLLPVNIDKYTSEALTLFLAYYLLRYRDAKKGKEDTAWKEALSEAFHALYLTRAYYAKTQLDPAVTRSAKEEDINTWLDERAKTEVNRLLHFIGQLVLVAVILAAEPIEMNRKYAQEKPLAQRRDADRCSFCGKSQDQVQRLIAGPGGVYICDECIDLCREIIEEEQATAVSSRPKPQASQVPLTKQCPTCGAQNDADAKFCIHCGTKLP